MYLVMSNLVTFILSIIFSIFCLKLLIPFLCIDLPNERSLHENPKARGGGIVFILISLVFLPFTGFYSIFLFLPLAIISFLDDLYYLGAKTRYFIHVTTICLFLKTNLDLSFLDNEFLFSATFLFLIIMGTSIINFSNCIDGIDGLLTSTMIIVFINSIFINKSAYLIPIIGSLIAFYFFNKTPAKVFMGDIGSTFLGSLLFFEIIRANNLNDSFMILSVSFPIMFDAFLCVIRRFINNENIFRPHKKHLYQRLVKSGYSHTKVTTIYSIACIIISLTCFTGNK